MPGIRPPPVRVAQLLAVAALACASGIASAAVLAQASLAPPAAKASHPVAKPPVARPAEGRPVWAELNVEQQQALRPLAPTWNTMTEAHKRKWLALVANYRKLPPDEQAKLTSRMIEWAALSPQLRAQARLNFGEAKRVPADERKAKWEAYQALSPEEKRKLAAGAAGRTPPTAAAVRPVPPQKLAHVPQGGRDAKSPRIVAGQGHEQVPAPHPASPVPAPAAPASQAN